MADPSRIPGPSPAKRQRLSLDTLSTPSPTAGSLLDLTVKTERSPSPALNLPQTTGAKFYTMPKDCRKTMPDYRRNRSRFVAARKAELSLLGLELTRQLWRTDGLVFDWKSETPVMPDTLRPPKDVSTQNYISEDSEILAGPDESRVTARLDTTSDRYPVQRSTENERGDKTIVHLHSKPALEHLYHDNTASSTPSTAVSAARQDSLHPSLAPPRPSSQSVWSSARASHAFGSSSHDHDRTATRPPAVSAVPSGTPHNTHSQGTLDDSGTSVSLYDSPCKEYGSAQDWPDETEVQAMTAASLQYVRKYISAFDTQRRTLSDAYRADAAFSYRRVASSAATRVSAISVTGRTSIARALSDIYVNAFADGDVDLRYDVVHLGNRIGTMAVVDGMMHESGKRAKALPFRWTFILRRNPVTRDATWTLQAASHQMVVYENL